MPLTLEQYAELPGQPRRHLAGRPRPSSASRPPPPGRLPEVRAVTWNVYGTLLAIPGGELVFEHPNDFVMNVALDKTIQEFKMWGSMSRKPGQPAEYMETDLRAGPRPSSARSRRRREATPRSQPIALWEAIIKKLLPEGLQVRRRLLRLAQRVQPQGRLLLPRQPAGHRPATPAPPRPCGTSPTRGLAQGLLADGQCFTTVQLQRGLAAQDDRVSLDELLTDDLRALSCEVRGRKPSERLFRQPLEQLAKHGHQPGRGAARRLAHRSRTSCRPSGWG